MQTASMSVLSELVRSADSPTGCGACEAVCPVEAIFPDDSVPEQWKHFTPKNAEYFKK